MTHLTPEELIEALEDREAFTRRSLGQGRHLAGCEHCQRELAELSNVLNDAKQVSVVPEPSPLFWQHFSERVRTAIDRDDDPGSAWPSWLRWQVLLPLGAAAMIILALMISVPKQDPSDTFALQEPQALEAPEAPDNWVMLADLVGEISLDTANEAGVFVAPGLADRAVLELTADEQQELTRLLKAELTRAKS